MRSVVSKAGLFAVPEYKSDGGTIASLDGIRALSVVLVFLGHARLSNLLPGGFGVTVFFFLSGFLITTLLIREQDRHASISLKSFYLRRLVRLGPPLTITLILLTAAAMAGLVDGSPHPAEFMSQLLFYYNYYSLAFPESETVYGATVLWSLSVEEHFYLTWPMLFIAFASKRIQVKHIVMLLVAILLWRCVRFYGLNADEWTIYISTDTRLDSMLYGCLLAIMIRSGAAARLLRPGWSAVVICGACAAVLLVTFVARDPAFRSTIRYSLQGIALTPLFYYATTFPQAAAFRPLNWAPVRWVGLLSYTIYLSHNVIIGMLMHAGFDTENRLVFIPLAAALTLTYSALIYWLIERPLKPLRARIANRPASPARASQA